MRKQAMLSQIINSVQYGHEPTEGSQGGRLAAGQLRALLLLIRRLPLFPGLDRLRDLGQLALL